MINNQFFVVLIFSFFSFCTLSSELLCKKYTPEEKAYRDAMASSVRWFPEQVNLEDPEVQTKISNFRELYRKGYKESFIEAAQNALGMRYKTAEVFYKKYTDYLKYSDSEYLLDIKAD